jgi:NADPH:quinone reductase-like Zn-dependent oxidoreductase
MLLTDAGAVPEVFMTAFDALFLQLRLGMNETVLVHAVGSGVGTAALQLARGAGARVIGTSRAAAKLARAKELGLEEGVLADSGWPDRVLALTGGRGADVILDLVSGPYLEGNLRAIAPRGRMIVVGVTGGARAEIDLRALLGKRAAIVGTVLRARPLEEKIALARAFTERVLPLLASGAVRPVVDDCYRPEQVAEAHARLEASDTFGKLVLKWS